jgi:hypothetical protein
MLSICHSCAEQVDMSSYGKYRRHHHSESTRTYLPQSITVKTTLVNGLTGQRVLVDIEYPAFDFILDAFQTSFPGVYENRKPQKLFPQGYKPETKPRAKKQKLQAEQEAPALKKEVEIDSDQEQECPK